MITAENIENSLEVVIGKGDGVWLGVEVRGRGSEQSVGMGAAVGVGESGRSSEQVVVEIVVVGSSSSSNA